MGDAHFDIAILGGGSAGMSAAHRAREAGLDVALFERRDAGGTCVNRGCVPKKLMVHAARQRDVLERGAALGWGVRWSDFDWPGFRSLLHRHVRSLSRSKRQGLLDAGVELVDGAAEIRGVGRVRADSGFECSADHIVVATGSRPLVPELPGAERALLSDDIFELAQLPGRLGIMGGGYIAVEFACALRRFGVEVAVFEEGERLLASFAADCAAAVQDGMERAGIEVHLDCGIERIDADDDGPRLAAASGSIHGGFDAVLLAVGRAPNSDGIGLEGVGVGLDAAGQIEVDERGRTGVEGIHAIGDVARQPQLTPVATLDGRNVVDGILGRAPAPIRGDLIPTAVFATPELGSVGLTEDDARARGIPIDVRRTWFTPLTHALDENPPKAGITLISESGSGKVLGFHAVGDGAAEMTELVAAILASGTTIAELSGTIQLHPTTAEEIVALSRGEPTG